jgi:hypothetical protein
MRKTLIMKIKINDKDVSLKVTLFEAADGCKLISDGEFVDISLEVFMGLDAATSKYIDANLARQPAGEDGATALHAACGQKPLVFKTLVAKASPAAINKALMKLNHLGYTVLHLAALNFGSEAFQALVAKASYGVVSAALVTQSKVVGFNVLHAIFKCTIDLAAPSQKIQALVIKVNPVVIYEALKQEDKAGKFPIDFLLQNRKINSEEKKSLVIFLRLIKIHACAITQTHSEDDCKEKLNDFRQLCKTISDLPQEGDPSEAITQHIANNLFLELHHSYIEARNSLHAEVVISRERQVIGGEFIKKGFILYRECLKAKSALPLSSDGFFGRLWARRRNYSLARQQCLRLGV